MNRASLDQSRHWLERALAVIPGATQTVSKGHTQWIQGIAPTFVSRAQGARIQDVDGRWYFDLPASLGPVILGHAHPAVSDAIKTQLLDGIVFSLPHTLEVEVAERICSIVPCAERVRFGKTGSDATSAAVRVARAYTGRERVIVTGYHGWHDWYIGTTKRFRGVPSAVRTLTEAVAPWDTEAVRRALERSAGEVACVIVEPIGIREPEPGYLQAIIDVAHEFGALAVFDEVISGFRVAPGGAQERYNAVPDLATFGKALGNGMPISALVGRADVMSVLDDVFVSGTHGGEALSLAAARATLDVMLSAPVHAHLWRLGELLQAGLRYHIDRCGLRGWVMEGGAPPWTVVWVREPMPSGVALPGKSLLQQELLRRGVLFNGSNFVTWAWSEEDVDEILEAYGGAFELLASALPSGVAAYLEGEPVSPVFRSVQ